MLETFIRAFVVALLLSLGAASAVVADDHDHRARSPFTDPATLDPAVPSPDSIIGHAVGDDAVRYEPLVRYLRALAEASDRIGDAAAFGTVLLALVGVLAVTRDRGVLSRAGLAQLFVGAAFAATTSLEVCTMAAPLMKWGT